MGTITAETARALAVACLSEPGFVETLAKKDVKAVAGTVREFYQAILETGDETEKTPQNPPSIVITK